MAFWSLRHFTYDGSSGHITTEEWDTYLADYGIKDYLFLYFVYGLGSYLIWSFSYYIAIFIVYRKHIKVNNYPTLYSYLFDENGQWNACSMHLGVKAEIVYLAGHLL